MMPEQKSKMYMKSLLPATIMLFFLFMGRCREETKSTIKTAPIAFNREGGLSVYRSGTDSVIVQLDIEIADTEYETQTGLMYRDAMNAQQGMFFIFPAVAMHSFYMKNTKLPLDLLFIDSNMKVATIEENAQPMDEAGISSRVPIQYVLEVNAGMSKSWGVKQGDSIVFTRN